MSLDKRNVNVLGRHIQLASDGQWPLWSGENSILKTAKLKSFERGFHCGIEPDGFTSLAIFDISIESCYNVHNLNEHFYSNDFSQRSRYIYSIYQQSPRYGHWASVRDDTDLLLNNSTVQNFFTDNTLSTIARTVNFHRERLKVCFGNERINIC